MYDNSNQTVPSSVPTGSVGTASSLHRKHRNHPTLVLPSSISLSSIWDQYCEWVQQNYDTIQFVDDILNRLTMLIGSSSSSDTNINNDNEDHSFLSSSSSSSSFQRIVWSLLDFHRFVADLAIQKMNTKDATTTTTLSTSYNPFGMSISIHSNQTEKQQNNNDEAKNVETKMRNRNNSTNQKTTHNISPEAIRFGLAILQNLFPIVQELVLVIIPPLLKPKKKSTNETTASTTSSSSTTLSSHRSISTQLIESILRRDMERIRFVLRLTLLVSYWYKFYNHHEQRIMEQTSTTIETTTQEEQEEVLNVNRHHCCSLESSPIAQQVIPGIMLDGGLHHHHHHTYEMMPSPPTYEQECIRLEREHYIGKRTGRRCTVQNQQQNHQDPTQLNHYNTNRSRATTATTNITTATQIKWIQIIVGELLYIFRPLFHAESDASGAIVASSLTATNDDNNNDDDERQRRRRRQRRMSLQTWMIGLGMDLSSLWLLQQAYKRDNNINNHTNNTNNTLFKMISTCRNIDRNMIMQKVLDLLLKLFMNVLTGSSSTNNNINITATQQEMKRRKMRLLLYILRCPIYDLYTQPCVRTTTSIIETMIPFYGGTIVSQWIWDYIYYWKYYRCEEG